jgi:DNA polymerase-4
MSAAGAWATTVLHADLDAFYAAVEVLGDPGLAGKPVIVGGTSLRGVVTSASYEARGYGVTSGMPTSRARRLCPEGVFLPPRFERYRECSEQVGKVFGSFSPVVEPLALDEAFLDIRGARRLWPDPAAMGEALRASVRKRCGLAVSVGIAPNKFLAKLASRHAKPDGLVVLDPAEVTAFLEPLPVSELWGVGERMAAMLRRLGLSTIGEVARVPPATLERALGSVGLWVARLAAGRDDRPVVPDAGRKSLGAEETFEQDLVTPAQMRRALLGLSDRVASRLRAQGISGRTLTLKVRFSNFRTVTRSRTLDQECDSATAIHSVAQQLLTAALGSSSPPPRVRLLGVSVSRLTDWPASEQISFERRPHWSEADRALDRIRSRFGEGAVRFASLLE